MQAVTKQLLLAKSSTGRVTSYCILHVRYRSITGHMPTDVALKTVTGGRIDRWMQAYEDFVGLTQVKKAQHNVIEAERQFLVVQEDRRQQQQTLEMIQSRLRAVSADLEKTSRTDARYLDLVHKEHAILGEESQVLGDLRGLEKQERETFALLSSALRDSHEKERARAERTKYWSILGSIVGAVVGIAGTTVNNHLKMKELRSIVSRAGEHSEGLRQLSVTLCDAVRQQSLKTDSLLNDLHRSLTSGQDLDLQTSDLEQVRPSASAMELRQQTEQILAEVKEREKRLEAGMQEIRQLLGVKKAQQTGSDTVVYVGPQVSHLMRQTEQNLERKIKYSALASATLLYAGLALTLPLIMAFFSGGS